MVHGPRCEPDELDRELDEHLIEVPGGRVGWRISIPAMMSYWSELARPIQLPRKEIPVTVVRATKTDPPYVTDDLLAGAAPNAPTSRSWSSTATTWFRLARPADTAAVIRKQLERG